MRSYDRTHAGIPHSRRSVVRERANVLETRPPGRARGVYVVEFVLVLMVMLPFTFAAGEFGRVSLADQILARATYRAAVAAGRNAADCVNEARAAFAEDAVALWLFDLDDDGRLGFVTGTAPDPDADPVAEVRLDIAADDGDFSADGDRSDDFTAGCGGAGSWIRVSASVVVRARFGIGDILRRSESWALNQT